MIWFFKFDALFADFTLITLRPFVVRSLPPNAAASSSTLPTDGPSGSQLPVNASPAHPDDRQDTIRRLLRSAIERTNSNGGGENNATAGPGLGPGLDQAPPDGPQLAGVQFFAVLPQPGGQSMMFMPNMQDGLPAGGPLGGAATQNGESRDAAAMFASHQAGQRPHTADQADAPTQAAAGPSSATQSTQATSSTTTYGPAPPSHANGQPPAQGQTQPGSSQAPPPQQQAAGAPPQAPGQTVPFRYERNGSGYSFHFDLGNFMHLAPPPPTDATPQQGAAAAGANGAPNAPPPPPPPGPAGAPTGVPLGAPVMTDVIIFGPGAPPNMLPLGPMLGAATQAGGGGGAASGPGQQPAGTFMGRPVAMEMLMQLMGGFTGRSHLTPDPERAQELLRGLKDPGLDLLMRLDRVLCAENGGSPNGLEGEGWKCAICMEGHEDGNSEATGKASSSSTPMERQSTAGTVEDIEMSDVERMLSGEPSKAKSFKGTGLKAFPCHHIFHETCIEPWLQSKTTCPTCRFDIDPLSTTLRLPASMQRTNPLRPAPVRPATGDARQNQNPYGPRPATPQGAAVQRAQQATQGGAAQQAQPAQQAQQAPAPGGGLNVQNAGGPFGMFGPSIRHTAARNPASPGSGQGHQQPLPEFPVVSNPAEIAAIQRQMADRRMRGFIGPSGPRVSLLPRPQNNGRAELDGGPFVPPALLDYINGRPAPARNDATRDGSETPRIPSPPTIDRQAQPAGDADNDPAPNGPAAALNATAPAAAGPPPPPPIQLPQPPAGDQGPLQSLTFTFDSGNMPPAFANAIFRSLMNGGATVPVEGFAPGMANNNNNNGGEAGPHAAPAAPNAPAIAGANANTGINAAQPPPAATGAAQPAARPPSPPPRVRGPKPWVIPSHKETLQEWVAGREKALRWRCDDPVCIHAPPEHFHVGDGEADDGDDSSEVDGEWRTWQPLPSDASGLVAIRAMEELHVNRPTSEETAAAAEAARQQRCPHTYHPQCLKISCLSSNWWLEDPAEHGEKIWLRCPKCRKQGWVTAEDMQQHQQQDAAQTTPSATNVPQTDDGDAMVA